MKKEYKNSCVTDFDNNFLEEVSERLKKVSSFQSKWSNSLMESFVKKLIIDCCDNYKQNNDAFVWSCRSIINENANFLVTLAQGNYIVYETYQGKLTPPDDVVFLENDHQKPQIIRITNKLLSYVAAVIDD